MRRSSSPRTPTPTLTDFTRDRPAFDAAASWLLRNDQGVTDEPVAQLGASALFTVADCPDCGTYLGSYRQTVDLGKDLRDVEMPAQVYEQLTALAAGDPGD